MSLEVFHASARSTPRSVGLTMRSVTHREQTSAIGLTSDGVSYPLSTVTPATGTLTPDAPMHPKPKSKVVRSKEVMQEEEERDAEDLMKRMRVISVHEEA